MCVYINDVFINSSSCNTDIKYEVVFLMAYFNKYIVIPRNYKRKSIASP